MAKAAIYLAGFYMIYIFFLSRDTWYSRNRTFILLSVLSSLILPFITIQTNKPIDVPVFGKVLSEVFVTGSKEGNVLTGSGHNELSGLKILNSLYLAGMIFFGSKFLIDFFELIFLIIRKRNRDTHIIRFHGFNTAGFSALGQVFINSRLTPEEADEIIRHEQNHLDHNHFFDIIFVEVVKVFQWFNPVVHLLDRSLRAVHEYQADEGCLKKGITVVSYQRLLLNQVFRANIFGLKNCFSNPTLIKKRMIMMTKKRSKTVANLKLLLVLPVIALVLAAFSSGKEIHQTEMTKNETIAIPRPVTGNPAISTNSISSRSQNDLTPLPPPPVKKNIETIPVKVVTDLEQSTERKDKEAEPFVVVEEMPMFPGGDAALLKYIAENVIYPDSAKAYNIQGRVIVRFAVTSEGTVNKASILKGVSADLDNEALRVVESLPKFRPGKQGGKAVPVWYMVPITFTLK